MSKGHARHRFLYLVLESERPLARKDRYCFDNVDEVLVGGLDHGEDRTSARKAVDSVLRLIIRARNAFVSAEHARFCRTDAGWAAEDLRSRHGAMVNWTRIAVPTVLRRGDVIAVGRLFFPFDVHPTDTTDDFHISTLGPKPAAFVSLLPELGVRLGRFRAEAHQETLIAIGGERGTVRRPWR